MLNFFAVRLQVQRPDLVSRAQALDVRRKSVEHNDWVLVVSEVLPNSAAQLRFEAGTHMALIAQWTARFLSNINFLSWITVDTGNVHAAMLRTVMAS